MTKSNARALKRISKLPESQQPAALKLYLESQTRKAPVKPMKKARIQQEKQKQLTKKEETARIREEVFARAGGKDELTGQADPTEMHHLLGGIGRRRQKQSVSNCIALTRVTHDLYHRYPELFADRVAEWCARYGYPPINRIPHAPLPKSSTPSVPEAGSPLLAEGIGGVDSKQEQLSEKGIA